MMHCWEKKYDYYATLTDATTACSTDGSCMGVYDHGCEEKGYYLCPQGSIQDVWFTNEIKSCVHIKTGNILLRLELFTVHFTPYSKLCRKNICPFFANIHRSQILFEIPNCNC